jgi:hypothetical protein
MKDHLVWGYIRTSDDLKDNSIALKELSAFDRDLGKGAHPLGSMHFQGSGKTFVDAFRHRIDHILEANGAYYSADNQEKRGHAQEGQHISFNMIQPYLTGPSQGLYPTIDIQP